MHRVRPLAPSRPTAQSGRQDDDDDGDDCTIVVVVTKVMMMIKTAVAENLSSNGGDGDIGDDSCGCGGNSGGQKEKRQNGRFGVWTMCAACGPVDNGAVISRI